MFRAAGHRLITSMAGVNGSSAPDGGPAEIVRSAYAALHRGDLLTFTGQLHDDVVWHHPAGYGPPLGGVHHGPVAIMQNVLATHAQHRAEVRYEPTEYFVGEDHVLALGQAAYAGPHGGGTADFAHLWLHAGGLVIGVRAFEDTAVALRHRGSEGHDQPPGRP